MLDFALQRLLQNPKALCFELQKTFDLGFDKAHAPLLGL